MFRSNLQGPRKAISSNLGGIFGQNFLYASRKPMVALRLDSLPTGLHPPSPRQISGYAPDSARRFYAGLLENILYFASKQENFLSDWSPIALSLVD